LCQTLVWGLRRIIDLVDFSTVPGLGHKLHGRLEEIDIQANQVIHPAETLKGCFSIIPFITHKAAYHIPVFLLYVTAIILLVRTRPGKGYLLITAISVEALIDELPTIIRIYAE
jgi:hypothetical protein